MFGLRLGDNADVWKSYRVRLQTALERAQVAAAGKTPVGVIDPALSEMLAKAVQNDWADLYAVEERLLTHIAPEDMAADFTRKVVEAERLNVPSVEALKKAFDEAEKDAHTTRLAIFRCLMEDVHLRYIKRDLDRTTRRDTISSYIGAGLALSVVFAALLFWGAKSDTISDKRVLNVVFVMLIGLCGAYFSRLTALNSNVDMDYDTLMASYRFRSLVLRGGVGMLAAVVTYYLIYSGLIAGDLFPKPDDIKSIVSMFGSGEPLVPAKDTAKLMVWCFLAGFSERFVTGTLERLEKTDTSKGAG